MYNAMIWVCLLVFLIAGCGVDSHPKLRYEKTELLYLKERPYDRLYVEIDILDGVTLATDWIDDLRTFLANYVDKPGGIEIVIDEPFHVSNENMPLTVMALLCTDGPGQEERNQPSYLHVVICDSSVRKGRWAFFKYHPHVIFSCPTAMFIDLAANQNDPDGRIMHIIRHEAGHIVGLCKNRAHSNGTHCSNKRCLMAKSLDLASQFNSIFFKRFKPPPLCDECHKDIELLKSEESEDKMSFDGPFLVRKEDGYRIYSLPRLYIIIPFESGRQFNWREALRKVKRNARQTFSQTEYKKLSLSSREAFVICNVYWPEGNIETNTKLAILERIATDPSPIVRTLIQRIKKQAKEGTML